MEVPKYTVDLIAMLDDVYPDRAIIDDKLSDTERYRLEGKIELLRLLKDSMGYNNLKLKDK